MSALDDFLIRMIDEIPDDRDDLLTIEEENFDIEYRPVLINP